MKKVCELLRTQVELRSSCKSEINGKEKFLKKWLDQWQGKILAKVIRSVARKTNTSESKFSDIISSNNMSATQQQQQQQKTFHLPHK